MSSNCPVCEVSSPTILTTVDRLDYYECAACDTIFLERLLIDEIDNGREIRLYDSKYWSEELTSSRVRAYGASLARVAEVILYCRIPIRKFIDIGTGPGYLLDAISTYLPSFQDRVYGVEKYPPPAAQSGHPHYIHGELKNLHHKFQAGCCIEVIEHLTPKMLNSLIADLARVSEPQSLFMFNTGLSTFVKEQDIAYLDPYKRGHIVSYGLRALRVIFAKHGFTVLPLHGKAWAFLAEFQSQGKPNEDIGMRIWTPVNENKAILHDPTMGSAMYVLALDTARAYR
jgi:hypothetical protein